MMGLLALGLLFTTIYMTKRFKDLDEDLVGKQLDLEDLQGFLSEELFKNKLLVQKIQSLEGKLMKDLMGKLEAEIELEFYMSQHMAELLGDTDE